MSNLPPQIYVPTPGVRSGRLILLEGPSGVGKTYQARKLVEGGMQVLYVSTESKWKILEDLVNEGKIKVWPIKDFDFPLDGEEKARIKEGSGGYSLIDVFDYLRAGDHPFDVIYFDSFMRYMWRMLEFLQSTMFSVEKGVRDTRAAYGALARKAPMLFDRLSTLTDASISKKPVHFVGTWGVERDIDYKGRRMDMPIVGGNKVAQVVNYFWDDVIHLRVSETGERVAQLAADHERDAKVGTTVELPATLSNFNLYRYIKIADGDLKVGG